LLAVEPYMLPDAILLASPRELAVVRDDHRPFCCAYTVWSSSLAVGRPAWEAVQHS
jgi:hypothetical protein